MKHPATVAFLLATLLAIVGYDVFVLYCWGEAETISRVLRAWGEQWPLFPYLVTFGMGVLFGHVFL